MIVQSQNVKEGIQKARKNEIKDFTGVNAPYEKPENPKIVLNTEQMDVQMCIDKVISHLKLNNLSI